MHVEMPKEQKTIGQYCHFSSHLRCWNVVLYEKRVIWKPRYRRIVRNFRSALYGNRVIRMPRYRRVDCTSSQSIPFFCWSPRATSLALNFSMDPSCLFFNLKTYLFCKTDLFSGLLTNFQVPFSMSEEYSFLIASSQKYFSGRFMASFADFGVFISRSSTMFVASGYIFFGLPSVFPS